MRSSPPLEPTEPSPSPVPYSHPPPFQCRVSLNFTAAASPFSKFPCRVCEELFIFAKADIIKVTAQLLPSSLLHVTLASDRGQWTELSPSGPASQYLTVGLLRVL